MIFFGTDGFIHVTLHKVSSTTFILELVGQGRTSREKPGTCDGRHGVCAYFSYFFIHSVEFLSEQISCAPFGTQAVIKLGFFSGKCKEKCFTYLCVPSIDSLFSSLNFSGFIMMLFRCFWERGDGFK